MRIVRMVFIALVGLLLVAVAIANRDPVTLHAMPAAAEAWTGRAWNVTLPLFLVILVSLLLGMVVGLVWEWLRESQLRRESARRARDIAQLEREVSVRTPHRDEVLALLDTPPPTRAAGTRATGTGAAATTLPAPR